jgi:hypothetical protein
MEIDIYSNLVNLFFRYSYPIAFIGSILYSIISVVSIDFFTVFLNRNIITFLNIYIGLCGYIGFCTFFSIQLEIGNTVVNFDNIYVGVDKDPITNNPRTIMNKPYSIDKDETQISLSGKK